MRRALLAVPAAAALIAAPTALSNEAGSVYCVADEQEYGLTVEATSWPAGPGQKIEWIIEVNGQHRFDGTFHFSGRAATLTDWTPAVAGTNTVTLLTRGVATSGYTTPGYPGYQVLAQEVLTCQNAPSPPTPPPSTPTPTPPPSASSAPVSPAPSPPPPVIPVGPDAPPKSTRKVSKRTRVLRGCVGPWRVKPRTAIRSRRGADGKWYSFRDVRRVTTITITTTKDGKRTVKRGRRVVLVSRGTYCGAVVPPVTG